MPGSLYTVLVLTLFARQAHQNVIAQVLQVQLITPPDLQKILALLPVFHSKRPMIPFLAPRDI